MLLGFGNLWILYSDISKYTVNCWYTCQHYGHVGGSPRPTTPGSWRPLSCSRHCLFWMPRACASDHAFSSYSTSKIWIRWCYFDGKELEVRHDFSVGGGMLWAWLVEKATPRLALVKQGRCGKASKRKWHDDSWSVFRDTHTTTQDLAAFLAPNVFLARRKDSNGTN